MWNIVLEKILEIKKKMEKKGLPLWNYDSNRETCVDYWVRTLGEPEYTQLFQCVSLTARGRFLLVRYKDYADIPLSGMGLDTDTFWGYGDGFFRECRSAVFDVWNGCIVLAPYRKFRNIGEGEENSLENIRRELETAGTVEFSDKLDGSMQSARFYDGDIVMAGSSSLDPGKSWRLADGYRMLHSNTGYTRMMIENPRITFIFEYISKKDAHVVNYDVEGLFLTGMRNVDTGYEYPYRMVLDYARQYGVPSTTVVETTLDDVLASRGDKKASEAEGFVMNIDGHKVKIKYDDYLQIHSSLAGMLSARNVIESIAEGTFDDMYSRVPEAYRGRVMEIAENVWTYKKKKEAQMEQYYGDAPKETRKDFMVWTGENIGDRRVRNAVRQKYLGRPANILKTLSGYIGYPEILRALGMPAAAVIVLSALGR